MRKKFIQKDQSLDLIFPVRHSNTLIISWEEFTIISLEMQILF